VDGLRGDKLTSAPVIDGAGTPPHPEHSAYPQTPAPDRRFEVQSQQAGVISNVAGDQYNEHALRIEPMRRRARNVMRAGFALLFCGFAVFVVGFALFAGAILHGFNHPESGSVNVTGWAIAAAGSVTMTLGVLVIIASLFMKRGVRQEEQRQ
jgi:hypothetical protein